MSILIEDESAACIVACETLKQELLLVMRNLGCTLPVNWIEAGKHSSPDKLRESVQETLDSLPPGRTVLLLFGFCGNAMVGVKAGTHTLILPKTADCIPLFIGSRKERDSFGIDTYFFTEGYLNSQGSITYGASEMMQRYGEKRGLAILKKMLLNYRNFAVIDTGAYDVASVRDSVEQFAKHLDIPVKVIPGSLRLIKALLSGNRPEDSFLTVMPGNSIRFEDSLSAGRAQ